ncbi:MAG: hypothetical protein JJ900_12520 [Rhodospirillales bacterium]|nr:hypothetical protein [Rhodospirillales bacterium]MBO6787668.1 hypothetical protein [Rhodospirillales bacterium]
MTIRKTITASAIALVLGFAASAQAASVDHYTEETNPAVFSTSYGAVSAGSSWDKVDHYTEETQPAIFGEFNQGDTNTVDNSDVLPYQRG